jgi:tartrate dehydratase beta subunit/fumarate hydratase class I family protein
MLNKGEELPVDFTNKLIYYVGPVDPVRDEVVAAPRSDLPIMPRRPVCSSIWRVNLSIRVEVVGPAGPTTIKPFT